MKLAILDTVPEIYWHSDEGITDATKFQEWLEPFMPDWEFHPFYAAEDQFPNDKHAYDAYLITGSPCSVNDEASWMLRLESLITDIIDIGKPLAGFCFGHQLIAKSLGGKVGVNENGWNIGLFTVDLEKELSWMEPFQKTTQIYHFNKERVLELPINAQSFAGSSGYPDYGFSIDQTVIALQGHPEQPRRAMENFLNFGKESLPEEEISKAMKTITSGSPDAALWGQWVANFFNR